MQRSETKTGIASLLIGLVAGVFGGFTGLGGGVVMIPLMVAFLKLRQHTAHGTSLVAVVFTGISGAITYAHEGSVDIMAALLLSASAVFTAQLGAKFAHALPEWKLKRAFGGLLIVVSGLLLLRPYLPAGASAAELWTKAIILLFAGSFTGFLSGMMGVGGGAVMVPAMVLFAGIDQHTAQGSSLLAIIPIAIAGAWTHWRLGNVESYLLPGMIVGVLLGTYAGASFAHFLHGAILRAIFALVLIWTGICYLRTQPSS